VVYYLFLQLGKDVPEETTWGDRIASDPRVCFPIGIQIP